MRRRTLAACCAVMALTTDSCTLAPAASSLQETSSGKELLAGLVGFWSTGRESDSFYVRQSCRWILNRKYLEVDTFVDIKGHPPSSWRTLIAYEESDKSYRLWRFLDDGVVTTERGKRGSRWNGIDFKGCTSTDRISYSAMRFFGDDCMEHDVNVYVDAKGEVVKSIAFTLYRVSGLETKQSTRPSNRSTHSRCQSNQ